MRRIIRDVHRPFRPWDRGYRGARDKNHSHPKPRELLFSIGVTFLIAVCVGLAVNYLVGPLSR